MNASILFACKGPWAALSIQQSTIVGYYCAAAGAVISLALLRESLRGYEVGLRFALAFILLVLHPAWTVSAESGDCGAFKLQTSLLATVVYFGLLIYQYLAPGHAA